MNRRAQFLEVLGIQAEWVPRRQPAAQPAEETTDLAEATIEAASAEPVASAVATTPPVIAHAAAPMPANRTQPDADVAPPAPEAPAAVISTPAPAERPPASLLPAEALAAIGDREASIATMDWPALEAAVSGCTQCGLCRTRTNTVFGVGDRQAEWMLVGEAPGENEDKQGEPFVGQAGKLLDNMLGALGLRRGHNVFIANVLKCRPPGNRNPEPPEVEQCEPYLRRQIALIRPKVIVVLGRFAAQSLLRTTTPIGKLRGAVHSYEGIPVVVTYHPAYLLRTLTDKARAWEDLCLAREVHDREGARA